MRASGLRRLLRRAVTALVIAVLTGGVAALGLDQGALGGFQRRATDALFPSAATDPRIVVVGLDGRSIQELGYPFPRSVHAALADRFADAGVAVAVWDVIFQSEPADATQAAHTTAFATALRRLPASILAAEVKLGSSRGNDFVRAGAERRPIAELADATTVVAHAQVTPDPTDGVVRTLPAVLERRRGDLLPGLSIAAVRAYRHDTGPVIARPDGVQAGNRQVPTEGPHILRLNWTEGLDSQADVAVISAADVIARRVDPARLTGKIVLVGATTPTLGDTHLVPVDKTGGVSGVMIHANAINTMLTASYLTPVSDTQAVVWTAVVALLVTLAVLFLPLVLGAVSTVVLGAGYLLLTIVRFDGGSVVNLVYPLLAVVGASIGAFAVRYLTETRQRRRVAALFSQYVPEAVARQLVEGGRAESAAEGERLDVSLFFCDLRGFTALSATLSPAQVRAMLNAFYEMTTELILGHGGTVLKFVGDEVFAVFGAPLPVDDDLQAALDCAMEIQRRAPELSATLATLGIPPVQFGIGLNHGEVVAAHVGGGKRRQYDVVGDTVNLGSRLCGQAGRGDIVVTASTFAHLTRAPHGEAMGAVALKGIDAPVELVRIRVDATEPIAATEPVSAAEPAATG